jgi:L-asparaginase
MQMYFTKFVCSFFSVPEGYPFCSHTLKISFNFAGKIISMSIRIFITGGTFDKEYNELNGQLYFKDTHLADLLEMGRNRASVEIRTLMMIDSLEMTDEDRELILHQCNHCEETKIVITHGTDTMADTAKLLGKSITDKTIILTGAMIPIKFGSSDGLFNLGSALAFAQSLPPGVYVAMNGRCFNWNNVRKNKQTGIFEELA